MSRGFRWFMGWVVVVVEPPKRRGEKKKPQSDEPRGLKVRLEPPSGVVVLKRCRQSSLALAADTSNDAR
jgi:hypothetical protein